MREQRSVVPVTLTADLRPLRVAFLLRDGDGAAAARAMRAASAFWGGWRSPLVLVGEDGSVGDADRGLVGLLRCDLAVNLTGSAGRHAVWPDLRGVLAGRCLGPGVLDDPGWWPMHPMSFPGAFPAGAERSRVAVPVDPAGGVPGGCGGAPGLWALAAVGGAWDADDVTVLARLGVELGAPGGPADLVLAQTARRGLLSTTAVHDVDEDVRPGVAALLSALSLTVLPGPNGEPDGERSVRGVAAWWNSRAVRPAPTDRHAGLSLVVPVDAVDDSRVVNALRHEAATVARCSPTVFVVPGPGATGADVARVRAALGFGQFSGTYTDHAQTPPGWEPTLGGDEDPAERWRVPRVAGLRGTLPSVLTPDGTPVRYVPPVPVEPRFPGRVAVRVSGRTVTGPRRPFVAELYLHGGVWDGPGVATVLEGLGDADLYLGAPAPEDVLRACFVEDWVRAPYRLGDKGRQAQALLERVQAAGVDERVLCRRATLAVAEVLTPRPRRDLTRAVDALAAQHGLDAQQVLDALGVQAHPPAADFDGIASRDEVQATGIDRADLAGLVSDLVRASLLEMTLPVRCGSCGQHDWLRVDSAPPAPACPGCGLPACYVHGDRGVQIAYRASSLLARAHQNGGLVPTAAKVRLTASGAHVLPGVDLTVPVPAPAGPFDGDAGVVDLDLLGWHGGRMLAGEAKTSAGHFGDLTRAVGLARHVGADTFLLVSPDAPDRATVAAARAAADPWGIDVEVLAGTALFD